MSATKLFVLALVLGVLGLAAWWFTPPAVRASVVSKLRPQPSPTVHARTGTGNAPLNTTVYKWTDVKGQSHYSNTPPKHQKYESVSYRNDANVVGSD